MAKRTEKHMAMAGEYLFRVDSEVTRQFIADGGADQVAQALADIEAEALAAANAVAPMAEAELRHLETGAEVLAITLATHGKLGQLAEMWLENERARKAGK